MEQKDIDSLYEGKKPSGITLLDIDEASLVNGFLNNTKILIVSGTKPWITMRVVFMPLVYVQQPEYWGIQVVGIQNGIGLPTVAPYKESEEVTQYLGTKGVDVIGANQTIKLDL